MTAIDLVHKNRRTTFTDFGITFILQFSHQLIMKSRIALFDNTIPQLFHQLDRIKRHTSIIFFFRIRKHGIRHHVRSLFLLVIPLRSISPSLFLALVGPNFVRIFSNGFTQFNQISAQFNIFQINRPRIIIRGLLIWKMLN